MLREDDFVLAMLVTLPRGQATASAAAAALVVAEVVVTLPAREGEADGDVLILNFPIN